MKEENKEDEKIEKNNKEENKVEQKLNETKEMEPKEDYDALDDHFSRI